MGQMNQKGRPRPTPLHLRISIRQESVAFPQYPAPTTSMFASI
jgi:hypothetical protein